MLTKTADQLAISNMGRSNEEYISVAKNVDRASDDAGGWIGIVVWRVDVPKEKECSGS